MNVAKDTTMYVELKNESIIIVKGYEATGDFNILLLLSSSWLLRVEEEEEEEEEVSC